MLFDRDFSVDVAASVWLITTIIFIIEFEFLSEKF